MLPVDLIVQLTTIVFSVKNNEARLKDENAKYQSNYYEDEKRPGMFFYSLNGSRDILSTRCVIDEEKEKHELLIKNWF